MTNDAYPPPPQYDHRPSIAIIEYFVKATEVGKAWCGKPMPGKAPFGCAQVVMWDGKPLCRIWFLTPDGKYQWTSPTIEEVRRHEHGHCNGWAPDHK